MLKVLGGGQWWQGGLTLSYGVKDEFLLFGGLVSFPASPGIETL